MSGNENSGRKPLGWYRDLNSLLDKSFDTIMAVLNNEDIPILERGKIAQAFLVRKVSEKIDIAVEHSISNDQAIELIQRIKQLKENKLELPPATR